MFCVDPYPESPNTTTNFAEAAFTPPPPPIAGRMGGWKLSGGDGTVKRSRTCFTGTGRFG